MSYLLLTIVPAMLFLSKRCHQAYQGFTWDFAKTVYRDFATYEKPRDEKGKAD